MYAKELRRGPRTAASLPPSDGAAARVRAQGRPRMLCNIAGKRLIGAAISFFSLGGDTPRSLQVPEIGTCDPCGVMAAMAALFLQGLIKSG